MAQQANTKPNEMSAIESTSELSVMIKESFSAWLFAGHLKRMSPMVCLSCMDKVSHYLIRKRISPVCLWELTNPALLQVVYNKAITDKVFKATDKKTYAQFVQVGQIFLKFLKSKPELAKAPMRSSEIDSQGSKHLTIKEAIVKVLQLSNREMTVKEIYEMIIENHFYTFGAQNPLNVVRNQISGACQGSAMTIRSRKDCFRCAPGVKGKKGEKVYSLLSDYSTHESTSSFTTGDVRSAQGETNNEFFNVEIWNDSVEHNFQIWLKAEQYATTTVRNYCKAVQRTVQSFKPLVDFAIRESLSTSEAVRKFEALLHKDNTFITSNRSAHNLLSASLAAFVRFVDIAIPTNAPIISSVQTITPVGLEEIIDLDEGQKGIREILSAHFLALYGYSNIGILWSAVQNSLSMFLNDNAINFIDDFWNFLVLAFKDEFVFSSPHIWESSPDYPRNSRGLIINFARQHGGIITREQIDSLFARIKLTTLYNSFVLDKGQLLFCDNAKFVLTETVNPTADRCARITEELNALFSCEDAPFIILRDISSSWFFRLPELANGLIWTPLLLQEVLRICPEIGYRVILPDLKGQSLNTLGAAVVPSQSVIQTFADIVHRFCYERYKLPIRVLAENLRLELRNAGLICGNELIYNMHKALKDYRFAFTDKNQTVMILER